MGSFSSRNNREPRRIRSASHIALSYVILGALWIMFSDGLVNSLQFLAAQHVAQTFKGWFFVAFTGFVLWVILRRWEAGWHADLESRKVAERALRESEERFREVADNVQDVIFLVDTQRYEMLYVNPAYERIWGQSRETLQDNARAWLESVHEEDRTRVLQALESSRESGVHDVVYRVVRPDGSVRWLRDRASPVLDDQGRFYRIAGVCRDITEIMQHADIRSELECQLRHSQKMEAVGQLAGGVAHDFNNLLTVIQGNLEFLDVVPDSEDAVTVSAIQAAVSRAAALTRQLLVFSRKTEPKMGPVNVPELVEQLARMLRRTLGEQVEIKLECGRDIPPIYADAGMLEQVLMNLAVNARDAMVNGGTLRLNVTSKATTVVILVEDTGHGISEEHLPRIFEPFYTTKEMHKGTGLGLATAYGIVKQHDGHITVESTVGRGTMFRIELPAAAAHQLLRHTGPSALPAPLRGTGTVLVIEDEPLVGMIVEKGLRRAGYTPVLATSGAEALRLFQQHGSSLEFVLSDVVLPGEWNGFELGSRFREICPDVPILFMSGYAKEVPDGAQDKLLPKPFSAEQLAAALASVLQQKAPS